MAKKIRYLVDEPRGGNYVRAFKERRNIIVQVWLNKSEATGDPDGDWEMPGALGLDVAFAEAVAQTKADNRRCRVCGCTDKDCRQCIKKTGSPCTWVEDDLCSACVPATKPAKKKKG